MGNIWRGIDEVYFELSFGPNPNKNLHENQNIAFEHVFLKLPWFSEKQNKHNRKIESNIGTKER